MSLRRKSPDVVVVGCGVSGLTCGISLLEAGCKVKIITDKVSPDTTSDVAAAVWYPYDIDPEDDRSIRLSLITFNRLNTLSRIPRTGVSFIRFVQVFKNKIKKSDDSLWWRHVVRGFKHPERADLPRGFKDGYEVEVPLMDTKIYMGYLMRRFRQLKGAIEPDVRIKRLRDLYHRYPLIINCIGVQANSVVGDRTVYSSRGQIGIIQRVHGIKRGILYVEESESKRPDSNPTLIYVVPRSTDCILGGTAEKGGSSLAPSDEIAREILRNCKKLVPALGPFEVEDMEHRVGLRPGRRRLRLEAKKISDNCTVIHNYGHKGAGFTLSWGCAQEVVTLARKALGYVPTSKSR
jgi:D-amino-acid oxidase